MRPLNGRHEFRGQVRGGVLALTQRQHEQLQCCEVDKVSLQRIVALCRLDSLSLRNTIWEAMLPVPLFAPHVLAATKSNPHAIAKPPRRTVGAGEISQQIHCTMI